MKRLNDKNSEKNCKKYKIQYSINKSCQDYRARYPSLLDLIPKVDKNLKFYKNEIVSYPSPGGTIEEILTKWRDDFSLLEKHHGYIQWLFPLRVQGVNSKIHQLQLHEANEIIGNRIMRMRLLRAYEMMLQFYGLKLENQDTGKVVHGSNFHDRFNHLLNHPHNFLRITRILQSIGELGLQHFQKPLVTVFVDLLLDKDQLKTIFNQEKSKKDKNHVIEIFQDSCVGYWVNSILDDSDWKDIRERISFII